MAKIIKIGGAEYCKEGAAWIKQGSEVRQGFIVGSWPRSKLFKVRLHETQKRLPALRLSHDFYRDFKGNF